jgi:hypothetical protein
LDLSCCLAHREYVLMKTAKSASFILIMNYTKPRRNTAGTALKQRESAENWLLPANGAGNMATGGGMKTLGNGTPIGIGTSTTTIILRTEITSLFQSAAGFRCALFIFVKSFLRAFSHSALRNIYTLGVFNDTWGATREQSWKRPGGRNVWQYF